jgi:hypothetical protein
MPIADTVTTKQSFNTCSLHRLIEILPALWIPNTLPNTSCHYEFREDACLTCPT